MAGDRSGLRRRVPMRKSIVLAALAVVSLVALSPLAYGRGGGGGGGGQN